MFFWLLACTPESIEVGKNTDTAETNTTESLPLIDDSGQDSDTQSTLPTTDITFVLSGDWTGTTIAITGFTLPNDQMVIGDGLISAPATSDQSTLALPVPTDLIPYDANIQYGLYVVSLHEDWDGDGFPNQEPILGVSQHWLLYLDGGVPPDLASLGVSEGWNAVDINAQQAVSLDAVPLGVNIFSNETIVLGGSYPSPDGLNLALIPGAPAPQSILYDAPLSDPWRISLTGEPGRDHLYDVGDGVILALETPIVYQDADLSGSVSSGDTALYGFCTNDGATVVSAYLPQPLDLVTATSYAISNYQIGWLALGFYADGSSRVLDANEAEQLTACASPM